MTDFTHSEISLRHAIRSDELAACFPLISALRPNLLETSEWVEKAIYMADDDYHVLAAWQEDQVVALAGYRFMRNLIHGHFLYVDDLVASTTRRSKGTVSILLAELAAIGKDHHCTRLVLDTLATNTHARHFYSREGLIEASTCFYKPLGSAA